LKYLRPQMRTLALCCLGIVVSAHANLLNLWVVALLIGKVIPSGDFGKVVYLGIAFLSVRIFFSFMTLMIKRRLTDSMGSMAGQVRSDLIAGVLMRYDLSKTFRDIRFTQTRLVNETRHLQDSLTALIGSTVPGLLLVFSTLTVIGAFSPELLLILLVAVPFFLLLLIYSGNFLGKRIMARNLAENDFQAHVSLIFHFLDHVRVHMTERLELDANKDRLNALRRAENDFSTGQSRYMLANSLFHSFLFISVLFFGSKAVMDGGMGIDRLVALFFAVNLLYSNSSSLLAGYSKLLVMSTALKDLRSLSTEADGGVAWHGRSPMPPIGTLRFQKVSFGFPGKEVLKDLDFSMDPGNCVALVGSNGAGKTTLVHLLLGLLRPVSGSIRYAGVDLADIDMQAYRKSIGYVPQKPRMMPDSVRYNLSYGAEDVTGERIKEALRLSMALDVVERLPHGLDTHLGEDGARLSGGEMQRLAIASAMIGRPRILVMDEPTNHLDTVAVRQLIENLKGLPDSPTILIVSHNLEVLSMADRVLSLDEGRLTQMVSGHPFAPPEGTVDAGLMKTSQG
jgi:ABC-type bacteriocin/lantibiotic exporter with double-glycine peptidase domain